MSVPCASAHLELYRIIARGERIPASQIRRVTSSIAQPKEGEQCYWQESRAPPERAQERIGHWHATHDQMRTRFDGKTCQMIFVSLLLVNKTADCWKLIHMLLNVFIYSKRSIIVFHIFNPARIALTTFFFVVITTNIIFTWIWFDFNRTTNTSTTFRFFIIIKWWYT
jgi:hypothetical protein